MPKIPEQSQGSQSEPLQNPPKKAAPKEAAVAGEALGMGAGANVTPLPRKAVFSRATHENAVRLVIEAALKKTDAPHVLIRKTKTGFEVVARALDRPLHVHQAERVESVEDVKEICRSRFGYGAEELEKLQFVRRGHKALPLSDRVDALLSTVVNTAKTPLTEEEQKKIRQQIAFSLSYLDSRREELLDQASQNPEGYIYLTPQEQGAKKSGHLNYEGCHLQVCKDGNVYLTPKHEKLVFGEGTFKKVRLGLHEQSGKIVASASAIGKPEQLHKEFALLKKLGKQVFFTLFTSSSKPQKGKFILPYAQHRTVQEFMYTLGKGTPLEGKVQLKDLGIAMIEAIQEQHRAGIINHDIKLKNFLVAEVEGKLQVWSLDLGVAKEKSEGPSQRIGGTRRFNPPEAFKRFDAQEKKDIYSLATALFALHARGIDRILPWLSPDEMKEYNRLYMSYEPIDQLDELLLDMTHPIPSYRLSIDKVLEKYRSIRNL